MKNFFKKLRKDRPSGNSGKHIYMERVYAGPGKLPSGFRDGDPTKTYPANHSNASEETGPDTAAASGRGLIEGTDPRTFEAVYAAPRRIPNDGRCRFCGNPVSPADRICPACRAVIPKDKGPRTERA